jgi:transcriptional regulator with XRE-family HTH domain
MEPADIAGARKRLGLTQQAFADRLGISRRTVESWESGRRPPAGLYKKALEDIMQTEGRYTVHVIAPSNTINPGAYFASDNWLGAKQFALGYLEHGVAGCVIRDAEKNSAVVYRVRPDEWTPADEWISDPEKPFDPASMISDLIPNPAYDSEGWRG